MVNCSSAVFVATPQARWMADSHVKGVEGMMKLAQIPSAILWSSLLLVTAAAPASALNKTIFAVQINSALTQLTIFGQGFAANDIVSYGANNVTNVCNVGSRA
jgi:hypothetical protein